MEYILTTDKLTKAYKQHKAANEVSLHIRKGEVYGLIGRNGAGKTTVLKMICGLATPTSGSFTFQGKTGAELVSVKNRIGALIETPGLFLKMTAFQNVKLKCLACGRNDDAYVQSLLEQVGLGNVGKKLVQNFSLGMKQRLGIALALIGDPEFIVLDEPINGLDPQGIAEMREIIHSLCKDRGMTVIVSSHILDELAKVADSFGIINDGRLVDEFTSQELEKRCEKHAILRVDNNEAAMACLKENGVEKYEVNEDGAIRITSNMEDTSVIVAALVNNGIRVYELAHRQGTLEEYYLNRTGGKV